ncbi:MAG: hypothetical protein ACUVRU_07060 [Anaerolineae bacterium]
MSTIPSRRYVVSVVVFLLWLVTVALTLWNVYVLWQLSILLYARLAINAGADVHAGAVLANALLILFALAGIAFIILSGEYHRCYAGQPRSWRTFAVTLVVQIAIPSIYALVEAL